jgi:cation transport ATPase
MSRRFWAGLTLTAVSAEDRMLALIGVADPIKATTPSAIEELHRLGIRVVMVTGDNATCASKSRPGGCGHKSCMVSVWRLTGLIFAV